MSGQHLDKPVASLVVGYVVANDNHQSEGESGIRFNRFAPHETSVVSLNVLEYVSFVSNQCIKENLVIVCAFLVLQVVFMFDQAKVLFRKLLAVEGEQYSMVDDAPEGFHDVANQ